MADEGGYPAAAPGYDLRFGAYCASMRRGYDLRNSCCLQSDIGFGFQFVVGAGEPGLSADVGAEVQPAMGILDQGGTPIQKIIQPQ